MSTILNKQLESCCTSLVEHQEGGGNHQLISIQGGVGGKNVHSNIRGCQGTVVMIKVVYVIEVTVMALDMNGPAIIIRMQHRDIGYRNRICQERGDGCKLATQQLDL